MIIKSTRLMTQARHMMSQKKIERIEAYATMPDSKLDHIVWDEDFPMQYVAVFYKHGMEGGFQQEAVEIYEDKPGTTDDLGGTPVAMALAA
jgi:hypothetical protein